LLFIVGAVALWRAFQKQDVKPDKYAFVTYLALLFSLAWLSVSHSLS
jgi:tryptophan-rich sensory protein